jgi:enterochelin esterase-like enzyme/sugar lactone lactonase YvrE
MKKYIAIIFLMSFQYSVFGQETSNAKPPFEPAREPVADNKKGEVMKYEFTNSTIFPGTKRTYWVYVPTAYTPDKPACLAVGLDGILYGGATVFDNLIAGGEIPVTIAVFVASGTIVDETEEDIRYNRSNEFDNTDETFSRFLIEELLPEVEKLKTADGRIIRLSKDPNDRMIYGNSSGGICAFTVAWERPDQFARVYTGVGTYVSMRGGHEYHALIRKTEPKPIRIFLQDNDKDSWNLLFGSWYDANLNMESALSFAGYEVAHSWGIDGHSGKNAQEIFPDVMRWLWKGWPHKVECGFSRNNMLERILDKESKWEEMNLGFIPQSPLVSNANGEVFISDTEGMIRTLNNNNEQLKLSSGEYLLACSGKRIYIGDSKGNILAYSNGKKKAVIRNLNGIEGLLVTADDKMYVTQRNTDNQRSIWLYDPNDNKKLVDKVAYGGFQLALSPNHKMLVCSEEHSHWLYNYVIEDDKAISYRQRWYWLHNKYNYDHDKKGNMTFDIEGNLYVATTMGVQICDQNGRVRGILTLPSGQISSLCFGGENRDILYVISGGKLYSRKMNVKGFTPDMQPVAYKSQGAG